MNSSTVEARPRLALLNGGFRPFFMLAAIQAVLSILIWVPWFLGIVLLRPEWPGTAWHAHSLLFGYSWAVIAGFLLTAVPNWTNRTPLQGTPLLALVVLWIAGRIATTAPLGLNAFSRALLDVSFAAVLIAIVSRQILTARNWRNLKVILVCAMLLVANVLFHYEMSRFGAADLAERLAVSAILILIATVGGRIVPLFTANWLKQHKPGALPAGFAKLDAIVMAARVAALAIWTTAAAYPVEPVVLGSLLVSAGVLHIVQQGRWVPWRTLREPLVAILHVAFAFVGIGLVLAGLAEFPGSQIPAGAALHAWTAGAIATMTVAVMTRASLGHTGHPLRAGPATTLIYALIVMSALLRIAAAIAPGHTLVLMPASAVAWIGGYLLFLFAYGAMLVRPRSQQDG